VLFFSLGPTCARHACDWLGVTRRQERARELSSGTALAGRVSRLLQVARFCDVLNKDLTNRRKTADLPVTDTTGMSYATCLEEELARNMKRAPLAFYPVLPTTLLEPAALAPHFPGWDLTA
jgi:hypothetical protein